MGVYFTAYKGNLYVIFSIRRQRLFSIVCTETQYLYSTVEGDKICVINCI